MRTVLLLFSILILTDSSAQWTALASPPPTPSSTLGTCYQGITYGIVPCGKGKFYYVRVCAYGPSSGWDSHIYTSNDDLQTGTLVAKSIGSGMGRGRIFQLTCSNDSTVAWIEQDGGTGTLFFTEDHFINKHQRWAYINHDQYGTSLTKNYIFTVAYVYSTTVSWTRKDSSGYGFKHIPDVYPQRNRLKFINDSVGHLLVTYTASPSKSSLIKTADGGENWTEVVSDTIDKLVDFNVDAAGNIYVLKKNGAVMFSANGGSTWSLNGKEPGDSCNALCVVNDSTFYAGGAGGKLFVTKNGGKNWASDSINSAKEITDFYNFDGWIYLRSTSHIIYRPSDQILSVSSPDSTPKEKFARIYPSPALNELTVEFMADSQNGMFTENKPLISIYNLDGKVILQEELNTKKTNLDISDLPEAIYIAELKQGTISKKVKLVKIGS